MGSAKRLFIAMVVIFSIIVSLCVAFYGQIAVMLFAKSNNLDISYKRLQASNFTNFVFTDLKTTQHNKGTGLFSSSAKVRLILNGPDPRKATTDFLLYNVHFITSGIIKEASYNNIDGLVAMPFSELWNYKEISGKIIPAADGIFINNFMATGDSIRLSFNGLLTNDNCIKADIGIYFESKLIGKIPPDLTNMALKDSGDGWKSLTVKLEGDLSKPSIQVTGKLFRLNIGIKPGKPS